MMQQNATNPRRRTPRRGSQGPPRGRLDQILDAAVKLFAAHGFAATDVQEIADLTGVGKGSIYRHFGNKQSLLRASARHVRNQLLRDVDAVAQEYSTPLAKLRAGIRAFLQFFDDHPEAVALLIQERAHISSQQPLTFFEQRADAGNPWKEVLEALVRDGIFRPLPLTRIYEACSHTLFGAIFVTYFSGQSEPLAPKADALCDMLFSGLMISHQPEV